MQGAGYPRKVLFVDNSFTFGGAILSLSEIARQLPTLGIDPVVISGQPKDVLERLFGEVPCHSIQFPLPWIDGDPFVGRRREREPRDLGPLARWGRSLYWVFSGELKQTATIAGIARRCRADVIHLNNSARSQTGGALAARLLGIPCVSHMRGRFTGTWRSNSWRLSLPDHHVAISSTVEASLLDAGVPEDRISVIHNSVDLEQFQPGLPKTGLRESLGLSASASVVGIFGRIVPFKGVREFLRAFAVVIARGIDAQALVVGDRSDGPVDYVRDVHRLVKDLGLSERVVFTGFRSDVADLLRLCDVVAMPSLGDEGFGRTLVEAMAVSVPVVASNHGGPLDIVRDGVDGFLRDPREPEAFGHAFASLLEDDRMRRTMGEAARERALEAFSSSAQAHAYAQLYRRLGGQGR